MHSSQILFTWDITYEGSDFWVCSAAGTLEPQAYTRVSSAEFCNPILEFTPQISSFALIIKNNNINWLILTTVWILIFES